MEELNPELFTHDNYEIDFGHRLDLYHNHYAEIYQMDEFIGRLNEKMIGWCDASRLSVRPRKSGVAVMCEDDEGKFWFHILPETAERLMRATPTGRFSMQHG